MSTPSLTELRATCQPESLVGRVNAEHWAGRLYMRRVSLHVTQRLVVTRITPDQVTWLMIVSGWLAALALTLPGVWAALAAVVLIQSQLLFDCSDGEVARWRGISSATGVYLDRIGHYTTEAAMAAALGVRAAGGWGSLDGWTMWGLAIAVLVLLNKSETDLVHVARAYARLPLLEDKGSTLRGRSLSLRRALRFAPFFRAFIAVELSFLALAAALVDAFADGIPGTRVLVAVLGPLAVLTAAGHLLSVLRSSRLRAA
ncbi:CDP-alcohol phosphatidyltransferase family protein [Motilibacter deserti]|uniref:CDP-alcohol phosphatidyltransferase family protein n=1 Tax=Motilibacter deserti TaxID=2714956 RepID=A0ABX0GZF4_9ACTN|nr:CDP-alcohol phosphatidyltransferase family protein [Motilibacter deserti]NHC15159.1 CDP-alcohol phosphatidyltransferase family protein [Motilibacter deserti]